jgi:predicted Zn-dependent peptidase
MYNKTVLKSGIKVITEEIPFFKSATIGIWVNSGSKDETPSTNGMSHFIEHMMFKGTNRYNATEIAEIMDSVGGQLNAFTEKEQTCYYVRVIDRHVGLALELLADMLLNSLFDPVELERERGVILEEIRMYEDSPDEIIFDIFTQAVWNGHPLGRSILGSIDVVNTISREKLLRHVREFYVAEDIIIAAAGNIKHEEVVELVERYFTGFVRSTRKSKAGKPVKIHQGKDVLKNKDCEQVYLILGGKGISQRDDDKYRITVLDSILGGSMSSRLFQEIREKRGLVYSVCSFQNSYYDVGLFGIFAGTSVENLDEVIETSFSIVRDVRENGVDEKELIRAKEQIKGNISLALESTSNRMIRLAKSEIYHGRLIPYEEVFENIDAVTSEDVYRLSQSLLDSKNYGVYILGPVGKNYRVKRQA